MRPLSNTEYTLARSLSDPRAWIIAVLLVVLVGLTGWQDFLEAAERDCAEQGKVYNQDLDLCVKPPKKANHAETSSH